jgi:hypothetical protein
MRKMALALVAVMLFVSVGAGTAFARGGHGGGHHEYNRHGGGHHGGFSAGNLFLGTLAVAGGVAIVDGIFGGRYGGYGYQPVVYQQPVYYQPPPPVCWVERSPVFDAYGRPVGTMPVTRCTQPY